jgi:hypothetical protein
MRLFRHPFLILLTPLLMAAAAAAQVQSAAALVEDPESLVERVIKAAMDIRLDEPPVLELQPKTHSPDSGWYLGGQLVNLTGDARPEEMLLTQVPTFADGPRIESDVRVDSYRLGYRFPLAGTRDPDGPLSIHSLLGLALLDARFQVEGPERLLVEQGIFKGAPLMGIELEWPVARAFSLGSEMSSTVPLSGMPWIFSGRVLGRYHLAGRRESGLRAFGGVGYERIWLEDRGDVINDINSDSGAMLLIGIEARF